MRVFIVTLILTLTSLSFANTKYCSIENDFSGCVYVIVKAGESISECFSHNDLMEGIVRRKLFSLLESEECVGFDEKFVYPEDLLHFESF